jgi:hypothetical protein
LISASQVAKITGMSHRLLAGVLLVDTGLQVFKSYQDWEDSYIYQEETDSIQSEK